MDTILLDENYDLLFSNDGFAKLSQENKDIAIRKVANDFVIENEVEDSDDLDDIAESATAASNRLRQALRIGRYKPTIEQTSRVLNKLGIQFKESDTKEDKLDMLKGSKDRIRQVALEDPELSIHADDTDFLIKEVITQQDRMIKGEGKNGLQSFLSNMGQGIGSRFAKTLGQSDAGIREFFTENPEFDEDWIQKFGAGFGDIGATMAMIYITGGIAGSAARAAGATRAVAGNVATGAGISTATFSNGILRYQEAFENEIRFSGDRERAIEAGITNLPAAAVDTLGDIVFAHYLTGGNKIASLKKSWTEATTTTQKIATLQKVMADPKNLKKIAANAIAQGSSELAGDYSSGQLQFMSTQNDDVLPSGKQLLDSFTIGGALGIAGAIPGIGIENSQARALLAELEQQQKGEQTDAETKKREQEQRPIHNEQLTGEEEKSADLQRETQDEQGQGKAGVTTKADSEPVTTPSQPTPLVKPDGTVLEFDSLEQAENIASKVRDDNPDFDVTVIESNGKHNIMLSPKEVEQTILPDEQALLRVSEGFLSEAGAQAEIDRKKLAPDTVRIAQDNKDNKFYVEKKNFQFATFQEASETADKINNSPANRQAFPVKTKDGYTLRIQNISKQAESKDVESQIRNLEIFEELGITVPTTGIISQNLRNEIDDLFGIGDKPARKAGQAKAAMRDALDAAEQELGTTYADEVQNQFSTNLRSRLNEAGFVDLDAIIGTVADTVRSGATNLAEFTKTLVSKFGQKISQFAKELFDFAKEAFHNIMLKELRRVGAISFVVDPNQQTESTAYELNEEGKIVPARVQPATQPTTEAKPKLTKEQKAAERTAKAETKAQRRAEIQTFNKTPTNVINTQDDQAIHSFLNTLIKNGFLSALDREGGNLSSVVHDLIANFNKSRKAKGERIRSLTIFDKIRDLPKEMQDKFTADGASVDERFRDYILNRSDDIYVRQRVNSLGRNVPGLSDPSVDLDSIPEDVLDIRNIPESEINKLPGIKEAYLAGTFERESGVMGSDKLKAWLSRNAAYQVNEIGSGKKKQHEAAIEREHNIKFAESLRLDASDITAEDTIFSEGLIVNGEALDKILEKMKSVDVDTLTDQQLKHYIIGMDSLINDGVPIRMDHIFTEFAEEILSTIDVKETIGKFRDSAIFGWEGLSRVVEKIQPTAVRLARLTPWQGARNLLEKIYAPLNNAGLKSDNLARSIEKDLFESMQRNFNKKRPTLEQDTRMGIAKYLIQFRSNQDPAKEFATYEQHIRTSIQRIFESGGKNAKQAYRVAEIELNNLLSGIDEDAENFAQHAHNIILGNLTEAERGYVFDSVNIFSKYRDDMRFITEVVRGHPWQDVTSYSRTSQIAVTQATESAINDVETVLDHAEYDAMIHGDKDALYSNSLMRRPSNAKVRTVVLDADKVYMLRATVLDVQAARMTAFETATAIPRRITTELLNNAGIAEAINANPKVDGKAYITESNPRRIELLRKWFAEEVMNMASQPSFLGGWHRSLTSWARTVGLLQLSKLFRIISEPLSGYGDYQVRNFGNFTRQKALFDAPRHINRLKNILIAAGIPDRAGMGEETLKIPTFRPSTLGVAGNKAKDIADSISKFIGFPLHAGDQIAAQPIFLAYYGSMMKEAGLAPNGLDSINPSDPINQEVLSRAANATDAIINSTRNSSRGLFFQNHNKHVSAARNATVTFASHGTNMASQVGTALRDLTFFTRERELNSPEARAAVKRILGIGIQSAGFTFGKVAVGIGLTMAIKSAFRDADDEEKMTLLRQDLAKKKSKRVKNDRDRNEIASLEDELQLLQTARDTIIQLERKAGTKNFGKRMLKDAAGNVWVVSSLFPAIVDGIALHVIDPGYEKAFVAAKAEQKLILEAQANLARDIRDIKTEGKIRQAIEDLEASEYIAIGRQQFGAPNPVTGTFGIGFGIASDFVKEGAKGMMGLEEFSINDMVLGMAATGMGQGDVNDFLRTVDRIEDKQASILRNRVKAEEAKKRKEALKPKRRSLPNIKFNLTR